MEGAATGLCIAGEATAGEPVESRLASTVLEEAMLEVPGSGNPEAEGGA